MSSVVHLSEKLIEKHASDAMELLEKEKPAAVSSFLRSVSVPSAGMILSGMLPQKSTEIIVAAPVEKAAEWLSAMNIHHAALLLRRLPHSSRDPLIALLETNVQAPVKQLLQYPAETVGAALDPRVFVLTGDMTLAQTLKSIEKETALDHQYLYVIDRNQVFLGMLTLRDCMKAHPKTKVEDIMHRPAMTLSPNLRLEVAARNSLWDDYVELPVVHRSGKFLGILHREAVKTSVARGSEEPQTGALDSIAALGELYGLGAAAVLGAVGLFKRNHTDESKGAQ